MSNNPASAFLSNDFTFLLSVFDTRRGDREEDEFEKVLSFYPTTAALTIRTTIVGLAQAISTFPSSFAEVGHSSAAECVEDPLCRDPDQSAPTMIRKFG